MIRYGRGVGVSDCLEEWTSPACGTKTGIKMRQIDDIWGFETYQIKRSRRARVVGKPQKSWPLYTHW